MYKIVYLDPKGRHILQNEETGDRYQRVEDDEWAEALAAFRAGCRLHEGLLDRLLRRAARRQSWGLYQRVLRAVRERRVPAPMPWGHVMFQEARAAQRALRRSATGS